MHKDDIITGRIMTTKSMATFLENVRKCLSTQKN